MRDTRIVRKLRPVVGELLKCSNSVAFIFCHNRENARRFHSLSICSRHRSPATSRGWRPFRYGRIGLAPTLGSDSEQTRERATNPRGVDPLLKAWAPYLCVQRKF
jgi:hypothetical protein